jgi:curved DNA-binding protein CbpA
MPTTKEEEAQRLIKLAESNLYKVLNVEPDANDRDIKLAYRKLALRFHPDKNKSSVTPSAELAFKAVNLANNVLTDPILREKYDSLGIVSDEIGTGFTRTDVEKFTIDLQKIDDMKDLFNLYLESLTLNKTSNGKDGDVPKEEEEELEETQSPLQQVFAKTDNNATIMAVAVIAIFSLYFYAAT